jgi:hypothetical protein
MPWAWWMLSLWSMVPGACRSSLSADLRGKNLMGLYLCAVSQRYFEIRSPRKVFYFTDTCIWHVIYCPILLEVASSYMLISQLVLEGSENLSDEPVFTVWSKKTAVIVWVWKHNTKRSSDCSSSSWTASGFSRVHKGVSREFRHHKDETKICLHTM